jgi:OHCU decarboxylase
MADEAFAAAAAAIIAAGQWALGCMTRNEFLGRFGSVFENRPDLAEAVWALGPDCGSASALHASFAAVLQGLDGKALTDFLNGHPDLAGRLLEQGAVTEDSAREQGSAGLDALDAAARARFLAMNTAYRARFGMPFIMAVRDRSAAEILARFEARLGNTPAAERAEAVRQIGRILLLRLHDRFGTTAPA